MFNNNLLIKLYPLASAQGENFFTESLVHLLRHIINYEPSAATIILSKITNNRLKLIADEIQNVSIETRVSTKYGEPDIVIRTINYLIYIEVKVESDFGFEQLKRYQDHLREVNPDNSALITLTRYPLDLQGIHIKPDFSIRWHQISDWLEDLELNSETSIFLVNQIVEFLKYRGVTMDQVGWELVNGLRSFRSLIDMVGEALSSLSSHSNLGMKIHGKTPAWGWCGYYLNDKKYFIGIYFDQPDMLTFDIEIPVPEAKREIIKHGRLVNDRWFNDLKLDSEEVFFFSRTKASQIQCIEKFIEDSFIFAESLW